jgi:hypothetical protein
MTGLGRTAFLIGAAIAGVLLIASAIHDPAVAAAGWLIGFVFWMQILLGSLILILIHRLTSGRWGEVIANVVGPSSAAMPLLIVLAIPLFVAMPVLYPWVHHPGAIKPAVLSDYLNRTFFIGRTAIALVGWSILALLMPRVQGIYGEILAGIGLVFIGLVVSSVSIDWYLSLEAPFTSSSFGASVAISSLVAALAWAAAWAPMPEGDPATGDVGALLLATVLGITYIDFMAVLVIWYGDLPREEAWFVARDPLIWRIVAWIAFLLGSLFPVLALIQSRFRNERGPLRAVGICTLIGVAFYDAYLIAPSAGVAALVTALLAVVGIGLALIGGAGFAATGQSPREALHVR